MLTESEYAKRLVRIWVLGFVGLAVLIGSVNWVRYFKLTVSGVPTEMTVKELKTANPRSIVYSYSVERVAYEGEGHDGFGNPRFELIKTGDPLKGFYEESSPSLSCLGDPRPQLIRESVFVLFIALLVPTALVWRARKRYKKWLAEKPTENQPSSAG